ncbi:TNF receptor-associated factor 1 isoform A [Alligator mississippiensis]|uniref:TNF receptor-associated factor 1 n=1 Tax=Alligator mississippiensis TaxID=8496 RepID=A0A151MG04_ALLMI|nr:TNF receptor-associated factor 1 isoform A [Alligator mississippiensis]
MSCIEWLLRNIPDPECLICGKKIVTDDAIFNFGSIKPDEVKRKAMNSLKMQGFYEEFFSAEPPNPSEEDPLLMSQNRQEHPFPKHFVPHPLALWFQHPDGNADIRHGLSRHFGIQILRPTRQQLVVSRSQNSRGSRWETFCIQTSLSESLLSPSLPSSRLLQMAEKATRGTQDVPSSSPDENEFPFGYPTSISEDVPDAKYLCSNCNNILKKAMQTLCGHRYCLACLSWIVRNNKNPVCQKCKEEDPGTLNEGSVLAEERAFSDAAINKEISELKVHCGTPGCNWSGIMKNFEEHQSLCEYALIPCHTGCGQMVMRKKLADHLENGCVNNMTTCQKCKQMLSSNEYQKHTCTGNSVKEQKRTHPDASSKEKNRSAPFNSKDGCRFSEVGCSFRGGKEKTKEHEKTSVGAHLLLLLQHIKQLRACLCPEESTLQRLVKEKMISELESKLQVFENIVAVLNKEVETSHLEIAAFRRQSELDQNMIRNLELKIAELHRCLTQKDAGLSRLHKSLQCSEQASYDGVFLWKIMDVSRKLQDSVTGRTISLYSPAFYTGKYGYKVCLRIYLNGDGTGKGTHVSLFFVVMKGDYDALLPWPFKHKVTFMLLDQNNREHVIDVFRPDLNSASFQRPVSDMNIASGCPTFLPLAKLQSPKYAYVKEDTIFLKCIIETNS